MKIKAMILAAALVLSGCATTPNRWPVASWEVSKNWSNNSPGEAWVTVHVTGKYDPDNVRDMWSASEEATALAAAYQQKHPELQYVITDMKLGERSIGHGSAGFPPGYHWGITGVGYNQIGPDGLLELGPQWLPVKN
jgi:hypothetical protein